MMFWVTSHNAPLNILSQLHIIDKICRLIIIIVIIYLFEMVIDNSWQYVYAVEQDKKAQSALTKTHTIHIIHVGLQYICTVFVQ